MLWKVNSPGAAQGSIATAGAARRPLLCRRVAAVVPAGLRVHPHERRRETRRGASLPPAAPAHCCAGEHRYRQRRPLTAAPGSIATAGAARSLLRRGASLPPAPPAHCLRRGASLPPAPPAHCRGASLPPAPPAHCCAGEHRYRLRRPLTAMSTNALALKQSKQPMPGHAIVFRAASLGLRSHTSSATIFAGEHRYRQRRPLTACAGEHRYRRAPRTPRTRVPQSGLSCICNVLAGILVCHIVFKSPVLLLLGDPIIPKSEIECKMFSGDRHLRLETTP